MVKLTQDELSFVIEGCIRNDRKSQEVLYKTYYLEFKKRLKKYFKDDFFEIETVINNAFLKIFKKIDKYSFKGSFEGWMFTILKREALNKIRYNKLECRVNKIDDYEVHENKFLNEISLDNNLIIEDIMKVVDKLSPSKKNVLKLFISGYTHTEIANILNISEGTSKWTLHEVRKDLKISL